MYKRQVYRVAGAGTEEFSHLKAGDEVDILGPLGNGFPIEEGKGKRVMLMGGGIGVPPMLQTAKDLGTDTIICCGYRDELFLNEEFAAAGDLHIATEDGSAGVKEMCIRDSLKIHVFNSRSASIGETLIVKKIVECEEAGMSFERVVETVELYISTQHTYFVLENLETLRKNGRLSKTKALVASALKIKPVMGATPEGDIVQLDQARGINKALMKMVDAVVNDAQHVETKTLAVSHCNCPERAEMVKEALLERLAVQDVFVLDTPVSYTHRCV